MKGKALNSNMFFTKLDIINIVSSTFPMITYQQPVPQVFLWGLVCDKDSPFFLLDGASAPFFFGSENKYQDDNVNVSQYNIYYLTSEIKPFDNVLKRTAIADVMHSTLTVIRLN